MERRRLFIPMLLLVMLAVIATPTMGEARGKNRCTITGTAGPDTLIGTSKRDVICGLAGDDILIGLGGNDFLIGGPGKDLLYGGDVAAVAPRGAAINDGADTLRGGENDDQLDGGTGNDVIDGNSGDDALDGGPGNDDLNGNAGDDSLEGGPGDDDLDGGAGTNVCDDPNAIPTGFGCLVDRPEEGATLDYPTTAQAGETVTLRFSLPAENEPEYVVLWVHDGNHFLSSCAGVEMAAIPAVTTRLAWETSCTLPTPAPDRTYSIWISTIRERGVTSYAEYGAISVTGTSDDSTPPILTPAGASIDGSTLTLRIDVQEETSLAFAWLLVRYPAERVYEGWMCDTSFDAPGPGEQLVRTCEIPSDVSAGTFNVLVWAGDTLDNRTVEFWTLNLDGAGGATLTR